jgi:hypothetical protein
MLIKLIILRTFVLFSSLFVWYSSAVTRLRSQKEREGIFLSPKHLVLTAASHQRQSSFLQAADLGRPLWHTTVKCGLVSIPAVLQYHPISDPMLDPQLKYGEEPPHEPLTSN